ncbi:hypothetical protein BDZ91DRAFT_730568 [Kalaharituber pfeilii]|nr:hypothetical protein BDZ91DRAFT_730568 [Kalaharituber pfeilii]
MPNSDKLFGALGLDTSAPAGTWDKSMAPPPIEQDMRVPRMGPTAGRSVMVQGDVVSAFTRLRAIVSQNRVRADKSKQRFHERPGLKRKRLRRERYRKRFKEGFKRMVGVIMDMKNRGM